MTSKRKTLWYCANGRSLPVKEMTLYHLINAYNLAHRICEAPTFTEDVSLSSGDDIWSCIVVVQGEETWHGRSWFRWKEILAKELKFRGIDPKACILEESSNAQD